MVPDTFVTVLVLLAAIWVGRALVSAGWRLLVGGDRGGR